jgi:purine-binding chemotaxis protein CheW
MNAITPLGEAERNNIYRARAEQLAREPEQHGAEEQQIDIVEFILSGEQYAIESAHVSGVHSLKELTQLPCTPPFVLGVVNMRGKILSVVDLRVFFELPRGVLSDLNMLIVLQNDTMKFAILADVIVGTRRIPRMSLLTTLPTLTGIRTEYLLGITPERLVVLDGGTLLADSSMVVHEEV